MQSETLIRDYIEGWKENNLIKILGSLNEECMIIESHGPTYYGKEEVKKWVTDWNNHGNKVKKWDITSFYALGDLIVCEWDFAYGNKSLSEEFKGITIAHIQHGKISLLREYRMTAPAYPFISKT